MRRSFLPLIVALVALTASIVGIMIICWHSWQFYTGVAALPPGSEIRLTGRGIDVLVVSFATLMVAIPTAIAGVILSFKHHQLSTVWVSAGAIALALVPFPLAYWLDGRIIAATGITLAQ